MYKLILKELKKHVPFTFFGAAIGILIMLFCQKMPVYMSYKLFYILHPMHVVLSALVTASIYKLYRGNNNSKCNIWILLVIGYVGSIGIATLSDSIIPFLGEWLLKMPNRGFHIGFIEKWWLVNPLAVLGVIIAYRWPATKFPHFGHVLISTWASLFHIILAKGVFFPWYSYLFLFLFLFIAVWIPCCISDIVFPLLLVKDVRKKGHSNV